MSLAQPDGRWFESRKAAPGRGDGQEPLDLPPADHDYLLRGGVFAKDRIEAYAELKWAEVMRWETTPSAVEFDMYYSA